MTTITLEIQTEPRNTVRFHRHYNPDSHQWELVRITEYHVGSFDNEQTTQQLADFWNQVYFEPTHYNATRVYLEGAYVADIILVRTKTEGSKWFIDRRVLEAIEMPFDPGGFLTPHAVEKAILDAWQAQCQRKGKTFP